MKRMTLIAAALSLIMITTVGAGVVMAKQEQLPPSFRVVQFDVTYQDKVIGKLSVNTDQWTYVFNAHGLEPGTLYYLDCLQKFGAIGSAKADANGDLHMQGAWDPKSPDVTADPTFILSLGPLAGSCVAPDLRASSQISLFFTSVHVLLYGPPPDPYHPPVALANQPITVYWWSNKDDKWVVWDTGTTDQLGRYDHTKAFFKNFHIPKVVYDGGTVNGVSYCSAYTLAYQ